MRRFLDQGPAFFFMVRALPRGAELMNDKPEDRQLGLIMGLSAFVM